MSPWTRNSLLVATLAALAPQARADIYDDAWDCASAVVDTVELGLTLGPKALKFVATQPSCVVRLGTPATAAPIGVVVGLANTGVLPASQPQCSARLYDTAAQPLAQALGASLGELGVLPDGASQPLADIASGAVAGEMLTQVPGMSEVGGSLTCGCELVEAGLSIESVEQVLRAGDDLGDACGGPVWDAAKEVAGEVVDFAGDAANEGIRQVSNLGDALAGQTKHMPYEQYFEQHWLPRVEDFASMEFNDPGNWHDQQQWRQMWEPCVSYFDGHTQSGDTAQYTCDNMRSGGPLFPERNFGRLMFRRLFDYDVAVAVGEARSQAFTEYSALPLDIDLPGEMAADGEAMAQLESSWNLQRTGKLSPLMDDLFGVPTRESTHDGLAVSMSLPPALFPQGTVGARAQDFFADVDANQARADAAKAVALAMADMDVQGRFVEAARAIKRDYFLEQYQGVQNIRDHLKDKDREQAQAWAAQCPTQACRDQIAADYDTCRAEVDEWYRANETLVNDVDTSQGRQARREWGDRTQACLDQARQTSVDNRWHVNDSMVEGGDLQDQDAMSRRRLPESRIPPPEEDDGKGRPERDPRSGYRSRTSSDDAGGESEPSDEPQDDADSARLLRRRAARDDVPVEDAPDIVDSLEDEPLRDSNSDSDAPGAEDFPGCAAVRGMVRPRVYACGSDEAYEGCRNQARGHAEVQCQRARR